MLIAIQVENIILPNSVDAFSMTRVTLTTTGILGKDQICYPQTSNLDSASLFLKVDSNAYHAKTNNSEFQSSSNQN